LHEPQVGALVLGDMIATRSTILVAPEDGDMAVYLAQLQRLAALEAKLGLPSHGAPIEQPSVVLRATHAHRLMREGKVLDALRGTGEATLAQLLPRVYDETSVALWPLAAQSLRAHLDKLVCDGVVRLSGRTRFALVENKKRE
jgi:glyoxylase-like metal-dependent hydrolase (beta-lactamase superfamily II)